MFTYDETVRLMAAIERGAYQEQEVGMNAYLTCKHCGASVYWNEAARRIVHTADCVMHLVGRFRQRQAALEQHPEGSLEAFLAKLRFDGLYYSHLETIAHAVAEGRGEPVDHIEEVYVEGDTVCASWRNSNRCGDDYGSFAFPAAWLMNDAHSAGLAGERRIAAERAERERLEQARRAEARERAELARLQEKYGAAANAVSGPNTTE